MAFGYTRTLVGHTHSELRSRSSGSDDRRYRREDRLHSLLSYPHRRLSYASTGTIGCVVSEGSESVRPADGTAVCRMTTVTAPTVRPRRSEA
jgi:hypothetical protein